MYPFKRQERRYTHTGEGNVKTEVDMGVMQPQAKEYLEPPEPTRAFFPRSFVGNVILPTT